MILEVEEWWLSSVACPGVKSPLAPEGPPLSQTSASLPAIRLLDSPAPRRHGTAGHPGSALSPTHLDNFLQVI